MDWLIQQIVDRRWTGPTGAAVEGNLTINSSTKFHNNPSNICLVIIYVEVWTQVLDQGCIDNFMHYTLTTSDLFQAAASANLAVLIESKHDHYFCCVEIWPTFVIFRLGLSRMAVLTFARQNFCSLYPKLEWLHKEKDMIDTTRPKLQLCRLTLNLSKGNCHSAFKSTEGADKYLS